MPIGKVTVNLYTCCKCQYKWLGGWDTQNGNEDKERPIPNHCPKCRNIRWNMDYTKDERTVFEWIIGKHIYLVNKDKVDQQERTEENVMNDVPAELQEVLNAVPMNDGKKVASTESDTKPSRRNSPHCIITNVKQRRRNVSENIESERKR
jgi:hypothetical protein